MIQRRRYAGRVVGKKHFMTKASFMRDRRRFHPLHLYSSIVYSLVRVQYRFNPGARTRKASTGKTGFLPSFPSSEAPVHPSGEHERSRVSGARVD